MATNRSSGRIGVDESGKGDYFGDLVIAGVYVDPEIESGLRAIGVKDCKRLADSTVFRMADEIRGTALWEVVRISPARYNELYAKMRNLNLLLAWGHARVIENLLGQVDCPLVVADKFSDERFLKSSLMAKGKSVELHQQVRAESDLAVAAASILARAVFLERLEKLSQETGLPLPKGATHVLGAARAVLDRGGQELLGKVAKLHFKTTKRLLESAPE